MSVDISDGIISHMLTINCFFSKYGKSVLQSKVRGKGTRRRAKGKASCLHVSLARATFFTCNFSSISLYYDLIPFVRMKLYINPLIDVAGSQKPRELHYFTENRCKLKDYF